MDNLYIAQTDLSPLGINLKDGTVHSARITFDGTGVTVWLDNVSVLMNVAVPGMQPGTDSSGQGWVGFTAATGAAWENQDILDWTFTSFTTSPFCCPPITTNCVPPSGSVFPIGTNTVNCCATDSCGQSNCCSFTVTVSPPPPLSITCPSNITVTACPGGAVVDYTVTVSGGCPPYTTNCVPPSGSVFPMGITTVNCCAMDSCGQSNCCSFTVTMSLPPLSITGPSNITVTTCSTGAVVDYTVTVSGGCPPITTNCVPPSGSVFPIGTTTVNCCATDSCGQTNCCSFTVTVVAIHWTQWVNAIPGVPGSAWGTNAIGVCVSYSGDVQSLSNNYPSWEPSTTFSGGTVPCPPPSNYGSVGLFGDNPGVNTIIFSKPVVDPVMAIWCLGSVDLTASFMFQTTNLIAIESGGPSAEFPFGTSITQIGNIIYGTEGNGTIQFHGTFTQISVDDPEVFLSTTHGHVHGRRSQHSARTVAGNAGHHASQHHLPWIAGDD